MSQLTYRIAGAEDTAVLAAMNLRLIEDERHRNRKTLPELEQRMHGWLTGEYRAVIFNLDSREEPAAYALYRSDGDSIYLRQFFVARHCRRQYIGQEAVEILFSQVWPSGVRVTLEVLTHNQPAQEFWKAVGFREYAISMEK